MNNLLDLTWLGQFFTISQLIGLFGYIVGVSAFLQRSDNAFRRQLTVVNVIMSVHFYLLGPESYTAEILNIINMLRNIASGYTRSLWAMLFFIMLMCVGGELTYDLFAYAISFSNRHKSCDILHVSFTESVNAIRYFT